MLRLHIGLMDDHREKVQQHCRVCGRFLKDRGEKNRPSYECKVFAKHLHSVFGFDITHDVPDIHPLFFSYRCKLVIDKSLHAEHHLSPYKSSTTVYVWQAHNEECCKVLIHVHMYMTMQLA